MIDLIVVLYLDMDYYDSLVCITDDEICSEYEYDVFDGIQELNEFG